MLSVLLVVCFGFFVVVGGVVVGFVAHVAGVALVVVVVVVVC